LSDCLYYFILVFLKDLYYLWEVSFDDITHPLEIFQYFVHFFLQYISKHRINFWPHWFNNTLDFLLVLSILWNKWALYLQNSLDYHFKLVTFTFFFIRQDFVISQNSCEKFVYLREASWQFSFYLLFVSYFMLQLIKLRKYHPLVKWEVFFQLCPRNFPAFKLLLCHLFF
jgi:hypothetical protein